jgi:hypothetical protein
MKILSLVIIITIINGLSTTSINNNNRKLRLEMYKFDNQYGIKSDRRCCFDDTLTTTTCGRKCSTFFSFCLKLKTNDECISNFETQIIGENIIEKDSFNQTTDLIEFPISNHQLQVSYIYFLFFCN